MSTNEQTFINKVISFPIRLWRHFNMWRKQKDKWLCPLCVHKPRFSSFLKLHYHVMWVHFMTRMMGK